MMRKQLMWLSILLTTNTSDFLSPLTDDGKGNCCSSQVFSRPNERNSCQRRCQASEAGKYELKADNDSATCWKLFHLFSF